jgi:hypothetical protein
MIKKLRGKLERAAAAVLPGNPTVDPPPNYPPDPPEKK